MEFQVGSRAVRKDSNLTTIAHTVEHSTQIQDDGLCPIHSAAADDMQNFHGHTLSSRSSSEPRFATRHTVPYNRSPISVFAIDLRWCLRATRRNSTPSLASSSSSHTGVAPACTLI